jgi:type IV pilus assembly protein PilA
MSQCSQKKCSKTQWAVTVVVGVAILGAAVYGWMRPSYQAYQVRTKLDEVMLSVDACRADVSQIIKKTTATKLSTSLFGCDGGASSGVKISRHLKSIAVSNAGMITVTLDYRSLPELTPTSSVLTVVPLLDATTELKTTDVRKAIAQWRCGSAQDGTTIPSQYLPSNCRG